MSLWEKQQQPKKPQWPSRIRQMRSLKHHLPLLFWFNYYGSVAAFHVGTWTTLIQTSRWFVAESLESTKSNTVAYESSACSEVPVNLGQSLHAESKGQVDVGFQRLSSQQRLFTVDVLPRRTEDLIKKSLPGFTLAVKFRRENENPSSAFKINGILLTMLHSSLPQQQWVTGGTSGYFVSTEKICTFTTHFQQGV